MTHTLAKAFLLACILLGSSNDLRAQNQPASSLQISFEEFKIYLDQVCQRTPLNSSKTALSGNAKLGFDGLLQRLGLTAGMSGDVNQSTTAGVPQEHLAASISKGNDCRVEMNRMFRNNIISPSPSMRVTPTQPRPPGGRRIAVGAFAIGDTIDQVRASGVQGQMLTNPDGKLLFRVITRIPVGNPQYVTKDGLIGYVFNGSVIDIILVFIVERQACSSVTWPREYLSKTIMELGMPIGPPTVSTENVVMDGEPFLQNVTSQTFVSDGEQRTVEVIDATLATNWSVKRCLVAESYTRAG